MDSSYDRIVSAALAETKSKFQLAEALALDIPPTHRGPTGEDERSVTSHLEDARKEIKEAGGEPRAVKTLSDYRQTALWVSTEVGRNFGWLPGVSFSAHREGYASGMSYEDFVALDRHTVDHVRATSGNAGTDGPPATIVQNWTPEQQAEAVETIVQQGDPEVLARATHAVSTARAEHFKRQQPDEPEPGWKNVPQTASSGLVELVARFTATAKLTGEIQDLLVGDSLDDMTRDMAADRLLKFATVFQAMGEVARDRDVSRWGSADDEALQDLLHGGEH